MCDITLNRFGFSSVLETDKIINKSDFLNTFDTSIEALKKRKLNILGIVFNNMPGGNKVILEDNCKIIKELSGEKVFGVLPWVKNPSQLYKNFSQFAGKIIEGF